MAQKLISQELILVTFYLKYADLQDTPALKTSVNEYSEAKTKGRSVTSAVKEAGEAGTCTKITV
jgi:hypothetical protein